MQILILFVREDISLRAQNSFKFHIIPLRLLTDWNSHRSVCTRDLRLGQRVVETNGEYFSVGPKKTSCIQCKCKLSSVICCFPSFWRQSIRRKRSPSWPQLLNVIQPSQIALCPWLTELYCKELFWSSFALMPGVASCVNFSIRGQLGYYSKALQL